MTPVLEHIGLKMLIRALYWQIKNIFRNFRELHNEKSAVLFEADIGNSLSWRAQGLSRLYLLCSYGDVHYCMARLKLAI